MANNNQNPKEGETILTDEKDQAIETLTVENANLTDQILKLNESLEKQKNDNTDLNAKVQSLSNELKEAENIIKRLEAISEKSFAQAAVKKDGFVLMFNNPFADGVIREYRSHKGKSPQPDKVRPFVLPKEDPATGPALRSLQVRASGAGNMSLADAAQAYLEKHFQKFLDIERARKSSYMKTQPSLKR